MNEYAFASTFLFSLMGVMMGASVSVLIGLIAIIIFNWGARGGAT